MQLNASSQQYSVIDLFCGTGGFAKGFFNYQNRFKIIYAIDIDPIASATARANHQGCLVETRDIRRVSSEAVAKTLGVSKVDVMIGGPPCQGFSSLRPYRSSSIEDERNDLYMAFASFADFFKPKVVVMENVVGLITHNAGKTLEKILNRFASLGYIADWRILNAANYGVPQKRERFIMIATRTNGSLRFPTPTHYFSGKVIGHREKSRLVTADTELPKALSVNDAISDLPPLKSGQQAYRYTRDPETDYQRDRRSGCTILTLHKSANHNKKMLGVIKHAGDNISSIPKHLITSGFSSCYSRLSGDEPSTTITVKFQSPASNKCIHPTQDRTITPREAARIQSFDDSYVFKGSITQIDSQIGNAVPPLLGRAIAKTVSEFLDAS
jgi:DNA (cytosine-5)-methyltransferase 1